MGGVEGSKGYLYQALAGVLNSIKEDGWEKVQMEPVTSEDKVDIEFQYEDGSIKVIQVKSSKNNFTVGAIYDWFSTLISDVPNASEYRVILIGTCSDNTKKVINCINKIRDVERDKETEEEIDKLPHTLKMVKEKLYIQIFNEDMDSFESNIRDAFHKFLSDNGYIVSHQVLESIVGSINYQFNKFSTNSSFITKREFQERILQWVNFNFPDLSHGDNRKVSLEVKYYFQKEFCNELNAFKLNELDKVKYILEKKEHLLELYKQIDMIKLRRYQDGQGNNKFGGVFGRVNESVFSNYEPCEYTNEEKLEINDKASKILNISINDDFYNLGNLEKDHFLISGPFFSGEPKINGTDEEIDKYKRLELFRDKLDELYGILDMFDYVEQFYIVPLVLSNVGEKFDEKIRVQIKLPKDIQLLAPSEFRKPEIDVVKKFTGDDSIFSYLLKHNSDSKVLEFENNYIPITRLRMPYINDYGDEIEYIYNEYYRYLNNLFSFEIYDDDPDYSVIQYNFKELKPKENIAFPSYLLVKYDKDFKINYEITSKNIGEMEKGELVYIIK